MFSIGFNKIAFTGHNNQGHEFKNADTNNATANVGPGGMSPQGIESYQPAPKEPTSKKTKAKAMTPDEAAQFLMAKSAKVEKYTGGSSSTGAKGVVEGLKKDTQTKDATYADVFASNEEGKQNHKTYINAGLK